MRRGCRVAFAGALLLGAAALGPAVLRTAAVARADEEEEGNGFVGPDVCRQCHADVHAAWSESPHALTLLPAAAADLPAVMRKGGTIEHPPGTSTVRTKDGSVRVETLGPDGRPATYPLTYTVGHRRIRMFLTTLEDGRLQVLPFMEESQGVGFRGRFFDYAGLMFGAPGGANEPNRAPVIAPGDPSFWTGPERAFDARCLRCHVSGLVAREPFAKERSTSTWRSLGIDCESCHGPGEAHAAIYHGTAAAPPRDPMVVRRDFTAAQAIGVCTTCHMEGEPVARFRPGDDVFETTDPILLDDPEQTDAAGRPFELVYAGVPFAVSACARAGRMTCTTCHVPHGGPNRALMRWPASSDEACAGCHGARAAASAAHTHHEAKGAGGRCVSCHMPFLTIERGHGFVADHTIGIPRLDAPGDRVTQDACTWCHSEGPGAPKGAPALPRERLRAAYAAWWPNAPPVRPWVQAIADGRLGKPSAVPDLAKVAADEKAPPLARATAAWLLGRFPDAGKAPLLALASSTTSLVRRRAVGALAAFDGPDVDAALLAAAKDPSAAVRLHAAHGALEGYDRVRANRPLLDEVLPILAKEAADAPGDDRRWFRLAAAREIAGDLAGAVAAYDRHLTLNPFDARLRAYVEEMRKRLAPR